MMLVLEELDSSGNSPWLGDFCIELYFASIILGLESGIFTIVGGTGTHACSNDVAKDKCAVRDFAARKSKHESLPRVQNK